MFDIKIREIRPKPKSNVRLLTENGNEPVSTTAGTDKIKNSNSQKGNFGIGKQPESKEDLKGFPRPSFIEEFIMKIREERDGSIIKDSSKIVHKDEVRHKILKYRPSLKEQLEEPEKNVLPVLRRNKIFTIASETSVKEQQVQLLKGYDSVFQNNKKRATTIEAEPSIE